MARYRKVDPRMWKDEKFRRLDQVGKLIAIYVITAQSNRIGLFNFSAALAAEELEMLPDTFAERFRNVCRTLNWRWAEHHRAAYLPTWWKYNPPENPNVLKSCLNDLDELPQTPLLEEFCANQRYLAETLQQTFRERMGQRLGERMADQEQEQEEEQEQEQETLFPEPATPASEEGKSSTKKPRKRDDLWDAVVQVTGADPKTSREHIGKVCKALRDGEPPYTPAEVLALPDILQARGFSLPLTPGTVEKYAGWTRDKTIRAGGGASTAESGDAYMRRRLEELAAQKAKYDGKPVEANGTSGGHA